nr:immunoglobulin heavy chain junction region [Mus musculus]
CARSGKLLPANSYYFDYW